MKRALSLLIFALGLVLALSAFHVLPSSYYQPTMFIFFAVFLVFAIYQALRADPKRLPYSILGIVGASVGLTASGFAMLQNYLRP
jgi:hypothetical protein